MIQTVETSGLQELEAGVAKLSPGELRVFSRWFDEFLASARSDSNGVDSLFEAERDDEELSAEGAADLPPLSQEWIDEINRRSREIEEGTVKPVPFVDPVARLAQLRGQT